jgi:hypothetical protein
MLNDLIQQDYATKEMDTYDDTFCGNNVGLHA